MSNKSKDKGSGWERDVCKILSLWISTNLIKDVFRRNTFTKTGDLIVNPNLNNKEIRELGLLFMDIFNVECKFYKNIDLLAELDIGDGKRKTTDLQKWWNQCYIDAINTNKMPLLIFKRNSRKAYVMLTKKDLNKIFQIADISSYQKEHIELIIEKEKVVITKLSNFLNIPANFLTIPIK